LFSITMLWPMIGATSAAAMRASESVALPGACGTISRIGLSGNPLCAGATVGSVEIITAIDSAHSARANHPLIVSLPCADAVQTHSFSAG
jgi:hypothetical protein